MPAQFTRIDNPPTSSGSALAWLVVSCLLLPVCMGCKGRSASSSVDRPADARPVTVAQVRRMDPATPLRATGTVRPWKQQDVGFYVGGRVVETIEVGEEVQGGNWLLEGAAEPENVTLLARMDDRRFRQRLKSTEAQKEAAELSRSALQIEIDGVFTAQLASAQAENERAAKAFGRTQELAQTNTASQRQLDKAEAELKVAQAGVGQISATIGSKKAELKSVDAQVKELQVAIEQAETDLKDCRLDAPFRGLVSEVHVIEGGFVTAGQPVVSLVMMDPMIVRVAVSAKTDRNVFYGDQLRVEVPELDMIRWGTVFRKDTEADTATRTFDVNILVRNRKIQVPDRPDVDLPRVKEFRLPRAPEAGKEGPLFLEQKALYQDQRGAHTWRLVDVTREDMARGGESIRRLERVDIRLGDGRVSLPGQVLYYELEDAADLLTDNVLACGVPEGFVSGGSVLIVHQRWLFRPGDLVKVELPRPGPGLGHYVPMQSIVKRGAEHFVFVVEGKEGHRRAVRTPIRLHGEFGRLRRVEAVGEKPLGDGTHVVLAGVAHVYHGEPLRVIGTEEVSP